MNARAAALAGALALILTFALWADQEEGLASWYGGKFQGRRTANGEIFDTNKFTAAHKTLPFGTLVRVTNLDNGKSTVVRINDRGPFIPGRIIDLSRAAAAAIGMAGSGVARVRVELLPAGENPGPAAAASLSGGLIAQPALYSIQVGSFRSREYAEASLAELLGAGFRGSLEHSDQGFFRVVVRGVPESEVEETKRRLRQSGFHDILARREL